jgi:phosphoglucomutase
MPYDAAANAGLIKIIGREIDEAFLSEVLAMAINPAASPKCRRAFQTCLHAVPRRRIQACPEALRRLGYKHVLCVPSRW